MGRDLFGVFPLRGKLLNVRDVPLKTVLDNAEIKHVIKIVGLDLNKKYEDAAELDTLRCTRGHTRGARALQPAHVRVSRVCVDVCVCHAKSHEASLCGVCVPGTAT